MSGERVIYHRRTPGFLASSGTTETAKTLTEPIYEGLVVDVILDHTHPSYAQDGYNVGAIKVRIFSVSHTLDNELLPWADPIDSTVQEIPLIGELVLIHKVRGNFFYTKKVPLARRIQENAMLNLNSNLNKRAGRTLSDSVQSSEEVTLETHKFGEYFKPDSRVRPLKHFEGDIIFQGRMGQSIRFGSAQMDPVNTSLSPNIILRTGQAKDNEKTYVTKRTVFGLTLEDINKDASSIWMTSDQNVPFLPATADGEAFGRTMSSPPQIFDKAQIIINSDRVVLNSKKENIYLFANDTIYLCANNEIRFDTDNNFEIATKEGVTFRTSGTIRNWADVNVLLHAAIDIRTVSQKKTSLLAEKIYIGSTDDEEEPLVGGTTLAEFLRDFIDAHLQPLIPETINFHVTGPVPSKLNPKVKADLLKLKQRLRGMKDAEFNSEDNFVMLKNEEVQVAKNDFPAGKPSVVESANWDVDKIKYEPKSK